jgi:hypothetical protein
MKKLKVIKPGNWNNCIQIFGKPAFSMTGAGAKKFLLQIEEVSWPKVCQK